EGTSPAVDRAFHAWARSGGRRTRRRRPRPVTSVVQRIGRLRYLDVPSSGSGRGAGTLLLLHGFPLNTDMWEPQLEMAGRGWRVIVPELRGFGDGAADPPTTSMDDYAGDTIDLLDKLHVKDAVVCGLSMGGYIAFALYRHAATYVRGLVLADTKSQADAPEAVAGRKSM